MSGGTILIRGWDLDISTDTNNTTPPMSSTQTTLVASPSAKEAAAATLTSRQFLFDKPNSLQPQPILTFANEWDEFKSVVQTITGRQRSQAGEAEAVLQIFMQVMNRAYTAESEFKNALFDALHESLAGFCEAKQATTKNAPASSKPPKGSKTMSVKLVGSEAFKKEAGGATIGFQFGTQRPFCASYGLAKGGLPDFACVVFRGDRIVDTTAIVELKLGDTTCADFTGSLDLANSHAPLTQGILHVLDVWHCLARRGVKLENDDNSLPVVVLAARRGKAETDRLCCMEAHLVIPGELGDGFFYRIDRCVKFPARNGGTGEDLFEYTLALAVFIKTLTTGLKYALELTTSSKNNGPVTLCCTSPIPGLELVASPIPGAKQSAQFTVTQGELYKFKGACTSVDDWFEKRRIRRMNKLFFAETPVDRSIVKVSFVSVHGALVPVDDSWTALRILHAEGGKDLKANMANTLLACALVSKGCLVLVMKDLSASSIHVSSSRDVWIAFQNLLKDFLIPMACLGIVHTDIRFNPTTKNRVMCNLLHCRLTKRLALIDFESLAVFKERSDIKGQNYAISVVDIGNANSPFLFVFWQVLWAAYVWTSDQVQELVFAGDFVRALFSKSNDASQSNLSVFKERIGNLNTLEDCLNRIKSAEKNDVRAEQVNATAELLLGVFFN
jgi:hypothetical protein